ncbi:MAG: hypothetical protein DHS20C13_30120 [Thermodesulfobacteriota bacterium]|nr:MAG: hypothetical protein DHS20C13_30120 [Thermodesulfobacteriota bacterium]
MDVWAIIKDTPISYDSAYLLGRIASHSNSLFTTSGANIYKIRSSIPAKFDVLLNRTILYDIDFLEELEEIALEAGAVFINSSRRTYAAYDKRKYLAEYLKFIPDTWIVEDEQQLSLLIQKVGGELVVKYPFGMCGKEVVRISTEADIAKAKRIFSISPGLSVVAQRFCDDLVLGDKRVILHRLENDSFEIVAWYKRIPKPGGWISNLSFGGRIEKCDIASDEVELCMKVAEIAGLDYVGLDIGKQDGKALLIEINPYTGGHMDFDAIHQDKSSGVKFTELVSRLCEKRT